MRYGVKCTSEHDENNEASVTYKFEVEEHSMFIPNNLTTCVWQICPTVFASLTCVSFGLMLGWPSPTYPKLLSPDSQIVISMDQSAMITGFLMIGVSVGTPFSSKISMNGPKYGILLGNVFIVIGWILMWQSQDVYWLLGSRLVLGMGHGYAMGQIKMYISEMCETTLAATMAKQVNLYAFFGLVVPFIVGPFVNFRQLSLIFLVISVFILFLAIFLPSTPRELIRANKIDDAKRLLVFLKPKVNIEEETCRIAQSMKTPPECYGFKKLIQNTALRINFAKFTLLVFCQQFSGSPPTLVYTQILFRESHVPYPEYIAVVYSVLFFISNIIFIYVGPKFNKKRVLLISSISVSLLFVCQILVIYFNLNNIFSSCCSVIVMYLFIIAHTVGLGNIPFTLINNWFPKEYRLFITKFFIIETSMLALIVTKVFQVLITQFPVITPFYLFLAVSVSAIVLTATFVPSSTETENPGFYEMNITKNVDLKLPK